MLSTVTPAFVQKSSEEQVAEQIRGTFLKGVKAGVDLYSLEESLNKKTACRKLGQAVSSFLFTVEASFSPAKLLR